MSDLFFHFTAAGKQQSLPKQIPIGVLRATRNLGLLDAGFKMIEMCASEETLAAFDTLDSAEGLKVLREWTQGLSAPNSSSSPNSPSESTVSPSSATTESASASQ